MAISYTTPPRSHWSSAIRVDSWSRRRRRSSVRSGSTAGAWPAFAARRPRGLSFWTTFMRSASAEEVAGELAALAALGAGLALPADLHLRRRKLDAVLDGRLLNTV